MSSISGIALRFTQPAIVITNVAAAVNTIGPANSCKRAVIRSFPDNAGVVWVDISTAAIANSCYPLSIGDGIELSINNTNEINILLESGGDKVAVLYEV